MARLYDLAKQWAFAHQDRPNGSSWDQWCQALMADFNSFSGSYDSAWLAYRASNIVSLDYTKAPVGAFHFFDIGQFGHVSQDLTGGGRTTFMASSHVDTQWGDALGVASVHSYCAKTGARYVGWSLKDGSHSPRSASDIGSTYNPSPAPSTTWEWVKPSASVQKAIQQSLKDRHRFSGAVDGSWEADAIRGIQTTIVNVGYTGLIDGDPGAQTCYYVQVYAKKFGGYTGPLDRKLGSNSWAGFAKGVAA